MKIIDCFPYNGESITLFRIAYLWDVVDEFIIVEATETHAGKKKSDLYLEKNAKLFQPFNRKITRLIIEGFPDPTEEELTHLANRPYVKNPEVWFREAYQRNFPQKYLQQMPFETDWIMTVCDADEIPRREKVKNLHKHYDIFVDPHKLEMFFFYYSSAWIKRYKWYGAYVVNNQGLNKRTLDGMRTDEKNSKSIANCGWHLSYFLTEIEMQRKIQSFAHTEYDIEDIRSLEWMRECQKSGLDLYHREQQENCSRYFGNDLPMGLREWEQSQGIGIRFF